MTLEFDNPLLKIEAFINEFRPSEQKIAQYILKNYDKVKFQTVNELASNSGVSDASVMRFIKKLGFKGFQYFKLSLASIPEVEKKDFRVKSISKESSIQEVKETIKQNITTSISDTCSILDEKSIEKAVNYILKTREIFIVGVGTSGVMARLLSYKFLRIGIITNYIGDSHLQAMNASLIKPDSLMIGISHSGSTRDTVDALKIACKAGAKTICITDHAKSPIAKFSDIFLCTFAREDPLGISQGRSSVSQVYVIETLIASLYLKRKEKADKARKITAESVLEKLY